MEENERKWYYPTERTQGNLLFTGICLGVFGGLGVLGNYACNQTLKAVPIVRSYVEEANDNLRIYVQGTLKSGSYERIAPSFEDGFEFIHEKKGETTQLEKSLGLFPTPPDSYGVTDVDNDGNLDFVVNHSFTDFVGEEKKNHNWTHIIYSFQNKEGDLKPVLSSQLPEDTEYLGGLKQLR